MPDEPLHIAVGVVFNEKKDRVLIAMRRDDVHQGGLWEFPGGKCEHGEDITAALQRELFEELNLHIDECHLLTVIEHKYPLHSVKLDVWSIYNWHGHIYGKEGQTIEWVRISELGQRDFPEANKTIVRILINKFRE